MDPIIPTNKSEITDQKILQAILQSLPSLVSYIDRDFVYRYVNDSYLKWFGTTREQCLGKHCSVVLGEDVVNSVMPLFDRAITGEIIHQQLELSYKFAGKKFVDLNYLPDYNSLGEVQGFFVIVHDLSILSLAQKKASRTSVEFERLINSVSAIIAQWDKNLINLHVNNSFTEVFGITREAAKGLHFKDLLGPVFYESNADIIKRVLQGETVTFEREFPNAGAKWRSRITTYTPNTIDGAVEGFFVVVTDITEVKEQARKLRAQREYYLGILDTMVEGYVAQNSEGHIISFNKAACEILALSENQLTGRTSMDPRWQAIHEDGSPFPGQDHPFSITMKTGQAVHGVTMGIKTPDAKTRWLKIDAVPFVATLEGKATSVLCTFANITEQILQKKMVTAMIENTPGVIYQLRLTGQSKLVFNFVSPKAYQIFETTPEEFRKNPDLLLSLIPAHEMEELMSAVNDSAKNLTTFTWRGEMKTAAGKTRWISAQAIPQINAEGEVMWDGILIDISHEHKMERELNEERAKASHSAKLASLGELSAGVAHEINNPLTVITGMCRMLLNSPQDQEKFEYRIGKIQKAVDRISKIVNGLKRFSRSEPISHRVPNAISEILKEALTLAEIKSKKNETELRINITSDSLVSCDPLEIEQVIINLLNNAIDACEELTEKWVELQCFDQDSEIVIRVIDSGKGIPQKIMQKLFDPFFTTKVVGKGTGLGLSIASGIIKEHGGSISVINSYPNTCFELRLPKARTVTSAVS